MINILFFIESLSGGGAEKVLCNLVNAMDKERFSITVQTLYPEAVKEKLAPGIKYKYCYPAKNRMTDLLMRTEAALGLTYPLLSRAIMILRLLILNAVQQKSWRAQQIKKH